MLAGCSLYWIIQLVDEHLSHFYSSKSTPRVKFGKIKKGSLGYEFHFHKCLIVHCHCDQHVRDNPPFCSWRVAICVWHVLVVGWRGVLHHPRLMGWWEKSTVWFVCWQGMTHLVCHCWIGIQAFLSFCIKCVHRYWACPQGLGLVPYDLHCVQIAAKPLVDFCKPSLVRFARLNFVRPDVNQCVYWSNCLLRTRLHSW